MHRDGHVDDTGSDDCCSMDRRKYLSTLAAGAAFGAVATGLASCEVTSDQPDAETERKMWGYLTVLPPTYWNIKDAQGYKPTEGEMVIRIPYYNNTGLEVNVGDVIGFTLKTVGCPPLFAIAYNLTKVDHADNPNTEKETVERNIKMDDALENKYGYKRVPWTKADGEDCPPLHEH